MIKKKKEEITIQIKLPSDYFFGKDELNVLCSFAGNFHDSFQRNLVSKAVEQALSKIKPPKVRITASEVKEKMLHILAERALEK